MGEYRFRILGCGLLVAFSQIAWADEPGKEKAETPSAATSSSKPTSASSTPAKPPAPPYASLLKDATTKTGMLTIHQKGSKLYIELGSSDYNREFIVLISIARGIGQTPLLGGYSWSLGDDWVWTFRKVDDRVHVIRRNVRFRANKSYPEYAAVQDAYTDSVLFSLRTYGKGPKGGDLVDFTPVFLSDLPQIARMLPGFSFSSDRSAWASIKAFERNVELELAATYASSGRFAMDTVADSRAVTINVHYSISRLPTTGYQPRLADDRVGYFLTVVKDFSKMGERDQFVRYINRWKLEKPPRASSAPYTPKQPIIFWIEKTVPHEYRQPVRAGIEEWNKAFAKAGWLNAIEVRQQPDDAEWDPEDINYNTFRWITSNAGFAMGPSRVNPYTGEILDADIIFDADFLQFWKQEFETLTPETVAAMTGEAVPSGDTAARISAPWDLSHLHPECRLSDGMARQMAFGHTALQVRAESEELAEMREKLIQQGLKEVVMHEVGHTLGLRHNFKGSRYRALKELNDLDGSEVQAMVASIMDYTPANIVPKDWEQGDYYPTTLGPYDCWAIEYGYKPLSGGTTGEVAELKKIAARSGEPALQYATDEDTNSSDPDPESNRFDLGRDPFEYAEARAQLVHEIVPQLLERTTKPGDDYSQARQALNVLLSEYGQSMLFVARYVGGLLTSRSHKGDKDAPPPYRLVPADQQRQALEMLEKRVFSDEPYQFPAELYNYLDVSHWNHWGMSFTSRKDFAVHDVVAAWQSRILRQLLSSITLERLHDGELKAPPGDDVLTAAELIQRLTRSVFSEVDQIKSGSFSLREPAISSLRRNLQRIYLRELAAVALGNTSAPDDCQTIAYMELGSLEQRIRRVLKGKAELDAYTQAHLQETADRIAKVRDAKINLTRP